VPTNSTSTANSNDVVANDTAKAEKLASYFRASVGRAYGSGFARSNILTEYFTELRTKD
jgi:hypothetical protein